MAEILARCGYRCDLCPAYVGNIKTYEDRQRASDGWHKYFGFRVRPEDIGCRGCSPDCLDKDCPVRPCAEAREMENCGLCGDFPCERIETRSEFIPRYLLEHPDLEIPPEDYRTFFTPYESRDRLAEIKKGR
ncbi:MAG: DUF3795 domain-containing protein [Patescibacteria group bacterium]